MIRSRLVVLALLGLSTLALAAPIAVSVADLLAKPDAYNDKEVKTSGKVEDFQQRTSKAGNDYFKFKLAEKDKKVNVYGQGKLEHPPKNGANVEVTGKFRKEKKVGTFTYKNEIETSLKGVRTLKSE